MSFYNTIFKAIDSKRNQNLVLLLYITVSSILFLLWTLQSSVTVGNNDGYITLFESFIKNGWYAENVNGTSFAYNLSLHLIYRITGSVNLSFFILNLFSQVFILLIGLKLVRHFRLDKYKIVSSTIILFYVFRCFMLEIYNKASNDSFLGAFVVLALYIFIVKIYESEKLQKRQLIFLGVVVGISIAIRPTGIFLAFLLFIGFLCWKIKFKVKLLSFFKYGLLLFITGTMVVGLLNYPSLKEKGKLSFYSKGDPKKGFNWSQRNFLALQKIQSNNLAFNHGNVWSTKFKEVHKYLEENGEDSLPKDLLSSIQKDPVLYLKLIGINIVRILLWIIRYTGILFFIPLLLFFKHFRKSYLNISFLLFSILVGILSLIIYTLIELRWFVGYEVLIYAAILFSLKQVKEKNTKWINGIYFCSVILVTLFNLRSILNLI